MIVDGKMYADAKKRLYEHKTLNILSIDSEISDELQHFLNALSVYSTSIGKEKCFGISYKLLDGDQKFDKNYAETQDVDIVVDHAETLDEELQKSLDNIINVLNNETGLLGEIEAYLVGNGINVSLEQPVFDSDLIGRYILKSDLAQKELAVVDDLRQKNPESKYVRQVYSIINKIHATAYAVENIKFIVQIRRKARRRGFDEQNFKLEINYHLNNFYLLMSSTFDILARLINGVYSLGLNSTFQLGVEKPDFQKKLLPKDADLRGRLLGEMSEWISKIKLIRNSIAHEESMSNTELVAEKNDADKLTREQEDKLINKARNWDSISKIVDDKTINAMREQERFIARIKHNNEVISEDIIVIKDRNNQHSLYNPIASTNYDFEKYLEYVAVIVESIKF